MRASTPQGWHFALLINSNSRNYCTTSFSSLLRWDCGFWNCYGKCAGKMQETDGVCIVGSPNWRFSLVVTPSALSASEARLAHDSCSHDAACHCQSQGIGGALSPNALAMTVMATRAVAKAPQMLSRCCFSKTAFVLFGTYRNGSCFDRQRQVVVKGIREGHVQGNLHPSSPI